MAFSSDNSNEGTHREDRAESRRERKAADRASRMANAGADRTPTEWRTTSPEDPVTRLRGEKKDVTEPVRCGLCPHNCLVPPDGFGTCRVRTNTAGVIVPANYGQATSLALDPIEKKPLRLFHPGSRILSYGSWGCNLSCPFCQNHEISIDFDRARANAAYFSPADLVDQAVRAKQAGNIGIAFTYNEPIVSYEYVLDTARLAHDAGLLVVLVSNGYANEQPWTRLMKSVDAVNVDLKAFNQTYYTYLGAPDGLETVKRNIRIAHELSHVEVSTLIVPPPGSAHRSEVRAMQKLIANDERSSYRRAALLPGNDTPEEIDELAAWIASVDEEIPLHLETFYPRWHLVNRPATSQDKIAELADVARRHLAHVFGA